MISDNYIPEKINEYNVYLDGVKMIGVASSHTLPEVNMQTSTVSGMGVNGRWTAPPWASSRAWSRKSSSTPCTVRRWICSTP